MGLREHLSPLRDPGFRAFFTSDVVNNAGTAMSIIALPFAVLAVDDSATAVGIVAASFSVPLVGLMLLGGAIADRLPRAAVLRTCNVLLAVTQATAATLVLVGQARIWQLAVLQLLSGAAIAVAYPAYNAMVPILVPESRRKSAFLLVSQAQGVTGIVGPAVAGVVVAAAGPGWGLAADAASYAVAAALLSRLRLAPGERPERQATVVGDLRAGWSYARSLGWVIPAASCALVFNALISGGIYVLGPVVAKHTVGSDGLGVARSIGAIGGLATTLVLTRVTIRRPLRLCMVGFATAALPLLAFGSAAGTLVLAAGFVAFNAGMSTLMLAWALVTQQKVREDMLSRIMAIDGFFSFVAMPIGEAIVGPLAHFFGPRDVEYGFAVACLGVLAYSLTRRVITGVRLDPPAVASVVRSGAEPA